MLYCSLRDARSQFRNWLSSTRSTLIHGFSIKNQDNQRVIHEISGKVFNTRLRWFGVIRISDPGLSGSWCIKGTDKSILVMDSSVPCTMIQTDLESLILIQITPKERTLANKSDGFIAFQHASERLPFGGFGSLKTWASREVSRTSKT